MPSATNSTNPIPRPLRALRWLLPAAAASAILSFGLNSLSPETHRLRELDFPGDAQWIWTGNEHGASGLFRFDFELEADVRRAWVSVAADGGFELLVNRNPVSAFYLWRATRPFQTGLSDYGQRLRSKPSALALNFPREHQWTGHESMRLPVYTDITPELKRGWNCLCVEVESRHSKPSFALRGAVELTNGQIVPLASNISWKASPVPGAYRQREWVEPDVSVDAWGNAALRELPPKKHFTIVPKAGFSDPFRGQWLQAEPGASGRQTFRTAWELEQAPESAYVRVLATAPYYLHINGEPVIPQAGGSACFGKGEWIIESASRRQLAVQPEKLDVDEVANLFIGEAFEDPRHGDPTENAFRAYDNEQNRSRDRPSQAGGPTRLDVIEELAKREKSGRDPVNPLTEEALSKVPLVLTSPKSSADFFLYDIAPFLRGGSNELSITLAPQSPPVYAAAWRPKVALDGQAQTSEGRSAIATGVKGWTLDGEAIQTARPTPGRLPKLRFLQTNRPAPPWWKCAWLLLGLLLGATIVAWKRNSTRTARSLAPLIAPAAGSLLVLGLYLLIEIAFRERSESLLVGATGWRMIVLAVALLTAAAIAYRRSSGARSRVVADKTLPANRHVWWFVLAAIMVATFVLRAWRIEEQPIDDDEYASVQAVLSIAETGIPELSEGVWYSRSPAYHYAAAAFAWLFGDNIVALRLFSVLAAVVTAAILYLLGSRVFGSRAIGAGTALLFALHPFCIFTAHIARFYQQQQLFVLLAVYLFIRGFVHQGRPALRQLFVVALITAVLSQEISIALIPAVGLCYVLLARARPFRDDLAITLAFVVGGALIALDVAFFKLKCMTAPTGVSPNVEATIKPHFWEPMNLFAMAIGYSRLHIVAAAFALWGALCGLRRRQPGVCAVLLFLALGILATNLLVTSVSFRYQYALLPLFLALAGYGIHDIARRIGGGDAALRNGVGALCTLAIIVSWSPWRIPGSYAEKQLGDSTGALQFVRQNLRESDKIMITEPHPHAALLELGRVDYDLAVPILYDFTHHKDGKLVDRNGGAEVVGHLGKLQSIISQNDRLWILVNREKFKTRGRNMRWEYPGARLDAFLRQNCDLKFHSYLWDVYLWDSGVGKYRPFRQLSDRWLD